MSSDYLTYLRMIENLNYFLTMDDEYQYVATEDIDEGQIIVAKFDRDDEFINIYSDTTANSLDEFINR